MIGALDTETGGLNCETDGLCSIAIVSPKNEAFYCLIKPNPLLIYNPAALKVNGFTLSQLQRDGIDEKVAVVSAMEFIRDKCAGSFLLGSNIAFDTGFLKKAGDRSGATILVNGEDVNMGSLLHRRTMELSTLAADVHIRGIITLPLDKKGLPRIGMDSVLSALGMADRGAEIHNAVDDCRLSLDCLRELNNRSISSLSSSTVPRQSIQPHSQNAIHRTM